MHLWSVGYESDDCSEYETSLTILIVFIFLPSFYQCPVHSSGFAQQNKKLSQPGNILKEGKFQVWTTVSGTRVACRDHEMGRLTHVLLLYFIPFQNVIKGMHSSQQKIWLKWVKIWYLCFQRWDMMPIINKEYHPHDRRIKKNTCSFTSASVLQSQPHFCSLLPMFSYGAIGNKTHGAKHGRKTWKLKRYDTSNLLGGSTWWFGIAFTVVPWWTGWGDSLSGIHRKLKPQL